MLRWVLMLCLAVLPWTAAEESLLINPDFEADAEGDRLPDHWNRDVGGGRKYDPALHIFSLETGPAASGTRFVRIRRPNAEEPVTRWFQYTTVQGDVEYRLRVAYRLGEDFTGRADVMAHGAGLNEHSAWIPAGVPGEWREVETHFTPQQTGKMNVLLQHRGGGTIEFDNVRLEIAPSMEMTNLIRNPSAETVREDGFPSDGWWKYPGEMDPKVGRVSADPTVARTGKSSVKFAMSSRGFAEIISPRAPVNPGDRLAFSLWYRAAMRPADADEAAKAREARSEHRRGEEPAVYAGCSYRTRTEIGHRAENLPAKFQTDGWEELSGEFLVPPGAAYVEATFIVRYGLGDLWVDDVCIRKRNAWSLNLAPYEDKAALGRNRVEFILENYTRSARPLKLEVFLDKQPVGGAALDPNGSPRQRLSVEYDASTPGKAPLRFRLSDPATGQALFEAEKALEVSEPLALGLVLPTHVWPERKVERVAMDVRIGIPADPQAGLTLATELLKADVPMAKQESPVADAQQVWSCPVSGLTPGAYRVRAALRDRNGTTLAVREGGFRIMDRLRPKVEVRDGKMFVNGKPFFPIGMFSPSDAHYKDYASAGFNFAHNYSFDGDWEGRSLGTDAQCLAILDKAEAAGLWFVITTPTLTMIREDWPRLRERFTAFRDHPAVLAYMEEEMIIGSGRSLETMKRWRDMLRELDPDRPVVAGDMIPPSGPGGRKRFPVEIMDTGVMWWYPFPLAQGQTEIMIPDWLTEAVAATGKPIWVAPQSWKNNEIPEGRFPLPEEYRVQAFLSVIHGAAGLMYFGGHVFKDPVEGRWEDLKKVVSELRDLSPILLAPDFSGKIEASSAEKVSWRTKAPPDSIVILAANRDATPATVTFTLPFAPASVRVRGEGRSVTPNGVRFQDTFARYAVHVYEITR